MTISHSPSCGTKTKLWNIKIIVKKGIWNCLCSKALHTQFFLVNIVYNADISVFFLFYTPHLPFHLIKKWRMHKGVMEEIEFYGVKSSIH